MKVGISPNGSDRAAVLELAEAATAGGIDRLWLGDGIFVNDDFPGWRGGMESLVELAWLAGRFDAGIGITAAVLPLRDVDWLVRQVNTLDHLTRGDFVCAVAPGFWPEELVYRGIDPDSKGAEFRSRLAELREKLVSGPLSPGPLTPGGPPIWLAGARHTMEHALALGLPFQSSRAVPDDLAPVAAEWRDRGGELLAHRIYVEAGDDAPAGDRVERNTLVGSAAMLADAFGRFAAMGVADLSLIIGHDDESSRRTLEVLVADVLPHLDPTSEGPP